MRLGGEVDDRLAALGRLGDGLRVGDVADLESQSTPSRFSFRPEYVSLSSTTTSSPTETRRLTKWLPMSRSRR